MGSTWCPSCSVVGEKTPRVGTYRCNDQSCRVHLYQEGVKGTGE